MICVQPLCNVLSEQLKALQRPRQLCIHYCPNKRNMLKCVITEGGFLTTTKNVWDIKIYRRVHAISFKNVDRVDKNPPYADLLTYFSWTSSP